jgi:uncharacterized membrane protein YoaK (UPF0700 family)
MRARGTDTGDIPKIDILLLTCAAGVLDAICYLRAHVFAANMTGNVVLLGLDLIRNENHHGIWYAVALAGFSAGTLVAALLPRFAGAGAMREAKDGLTFELPLAVAFGLLSLILPNGPNAWAKTGLILAGACAMGVQSVAVRRLKISGVATTFITGTITTAIVEWLSTEREHKGGSPRLLVAILAVYLAAATATALAARTRIPHSFRWSSLQPFG